VGTWIGQATITNCETGDVLQNFSRLTSFDRSGNVLETSTGLTPAQRTPALGVWEHARRNSYEYGLRFFRFDVAGNYIGYTRAEWSVTVRKSGNSYHATALIDVFLPNGVVVAHLCGTEDATRFETND
jgi:hypothetical protein